MALIGQIRKNSWLLVVTIGLALAAFLVMDMTSSGGQSMANQSTMAKINGERLDWREFRNAEDILYRNSSGDTYGQREYLWNYFLERTLLEGESDKLGLGVSIPEISELEFGNNPSPVIISRFSDPNTGAINRQLLNDYRTSIDNNQLDPQLRQFWVFQRGEIVKERLQSKINHLVENSLYSPAWLLEQTNEFETATITADILKIPFAEVDDAEIVITDADLEAYLDENAAKYEQQQETRSISFAIFNVEPTAQDSADILQRMNDLIPLFRETTNDSIFVQNYYGTFEANYYKKDDVNALMADTVFKAEIGTVIGPYVENEQYRLVKVVDRKIIPDSVQARHILRPVTTQQEYDAAKVLIDSLKSEIEAGDLTFEDAARQYGTDLSASNGGDLGMSALNRMVKPFNDLIFYKAEPGVVYEVNTNFGIHLVEVTGQVFNTNEEGVRLAYVNEDLIPSQETQENRYEDILNFVAGNRQLSELTAAVDQLPDVEMIQSSPLQENDYNLPFLGSAPTSREIVRWTFAPGVKEGEVSPEVFIYKHPTRYYNDRMVIVGLTTIDENELPSVSALKTEIEPRVLNEKKAELILNEIDGMGMEAAANNYGLEILPGQDVVFSRSFIPGVGIEPKVVGQAAFLQAGEESEPIAGASGIYFIRVNAIADPKPITNLAIIRNSDKLAKTSDLNNMLWTAIKDNASVEDNRFTFY